MPSDIAKDGFEAKTTAWSKWKASKKRAMCGGDGDVVVSKMEGKDFTKTLEISQILLYTTYTHMYIKNIYI